MRDSVQCQPRQRVYTDADLLEKMLTLLDAEVMSNEQKSVAMTLINFSSCLHDASTTRFKCNKLLQVAKDESWPIEDIKVLESQIAAIDQHCHHLNTMQSSFKAEKQAILKPLILAARDLVFAQQNAIDSIQLAEWRKNRN